MILAAALSSADCLGMDISRVAGCAGDVLRLSGDIADGDYVRFRAHFGAERRIVGIDLDSGGGSLYEGLRIAMLTHQRQVPTYVSNECDSACAFIFLASRKRYVAPDAKVGVHSVGNTHGGEDNGTIRDTIRLARLSAKLGIPLSTIGKMVATPPRKISYLNKEELAALKVIARNPFARIAVHGSTQPTKGGSLSCNAAISREEPKDDGMARDRSSAKGS
ncbi:hypothetical protein AS156_29175 [Bradyrhizobium macuxiense]|uniref:Uncharacterized protein n=1 Tax=Bradyrhizobium macuxiense TaxID=1755647 RepID=A0A125QAG3_9BRAD|nr:hypothetical protein AS156_29175 [Bradyrhizobium macuxiense]